jgi:hypothetical protein
MRRERDNGKSEKVKEGANGLRNIGYRPAILLMLFGATAFLQKQKKFEYPSECFDTK